MKVSYYLTLLSSIFITFSCKGQETNSSKSESHQYAEYYPSSSQKEASTDTILKVNSRVKCIFEDSKGNYWFGSRFNGVVKFDGDVYTYYTVDQGLPHNEIRSIQEDSKGDIWFATGAGICKFNGELFSQQTNAESWFHAEAESEWKKSPGDLWFNAGRQNGVFRYDGREMTFLNFESEEVKADETKACGYRAEVLFEDGDGRIWLGTYNQGVFIFDGEEIKNIPPSILGEDIRAIYQDKDGRMWIGNNRDGVYYQEGDDFINLSTELGLTSTIDPSPFMASQGNRGTMNRVWSIAQDAHGDMWFGTVFNGLYHYDGSDFINYTEENGLMDRFVESIMIDSNEQLWIGTAGGGVYRLNGDSFERISEEYEADDDC